MIFLCPQCGQNLWRLERRHTLWEVCEVRDISPDGSYVEDSSDFGETDHVGEWASIVCAHCESAAPADHPLWPTKEETHAE